MGDNSGIVTPNLSGFCSDIKMLSSKIWYAFNSFLMFLIIESLLKICIIIFYCISIISQAFTFDDNLSEDIT
jgi:hypothetical protein